MVSEVLSACDERMKKTVEVLKDDFASVRSGQANPKQFQKVMVNYYGSPTALAQLAGIQALDARTILINPYDVTALTDIEDALRKVPNIGSPNNDGKEIKISIPELTEERRRDYVKQVKAKAEDARVAVRNIRRKTKSEIEDLEIGEDEIARAEKELDNITKAVISSIDDLLKRKEAELLQI